VGGGWPVWGGDPGSDRNRAPGLPSLEVSAGGVGAIKSDEGEGVAGSAAGVTKRG